jgi:hypothetical protein
MVDGWRYYNHAMLTTGAPGDAVNLEPIHDGTIWKEKGYPLFARWISDYDCEGPTEWWYCLKDDEYRIDNINSKKRYRITRGRKCFEVRLINEVDYLEDIVNVQISAFKKYPTEYRPSLDRDRLREQIRTWSTQKHVVFGAFDREHSQLCGYALVNEYERYCYFVQQKVEPNCEKNEINAALVDGILQYYNLRIQNGYPIVDGQRNTVHETAFQTLL